MVDIHPSKTRTGEAWFGPPCDTAKKMRVPFRVDAGADLYVEVLKAILRTARYPHLYCGRELRVVQGGDEFRVKFGKPIDPGDVYELLATDGTVIVSRELKGHRLRRPAGQPY